jgi:hypothetical protein
LVLDQNRQQNVLHLLNMLRDLDDDDDDDDDCEYDTESENEFT